MKKVFCYIRPFLWCLVIYDAAAQQMHQVMVTINQPPQLVANAGPDIVNDSPLEIALGGNPTASGGTAPYHYQWTPASKLSDALSANPVLNLIEAAPIYSVTVTDARGCTASDDVDVAVTVVAIERENNSIRIFPNPASKIITISTTAPGSDIELTTVTGQIISTVDNAKTEHDLDVSHVAAGVYLLRVKNDSKIKIIKILIR